MTTDLETHTLRNGSTISIICIYPEYNDPLVLEAIVDAMKHIGLFDGIFDKDKRKTCKRSNKKTQHQTVD